MNVEKILLAALFVSTPALALGAAEPVRIAVAPLPDMPSHAWTDRQFIQADKEGRVFLLREKTLDLYQLSAGGGLIPKGRFTDDVTPTERPPITDAAMNLAGDTWVLFSFPNRIDVFRGEERKAHLEAPWMVSAVAAGQGEPLVAVLPAEMGTATPASLRLDVPPLLQHWDGRRWSVLAEGRFGDERPAGVSYPEYLRGEFAVFLAPTPERHLWVTDEHAYRLRHFSPSGVLKDELVVGDGRAVWKERTAEEWARAETAAKKAGLAFSRGSLSASRAEDLIRATAVGRDGSVYVLVQTEKGLALDRFHPALLSLDRVILTGVESGPGRLTMAAGQHGLYIAGRSGRDGLWLIHSETLDEADWQPVPAAVLNGQPLVPPKEKKVEAGGS